MFPAVSPVGGGVVVGGNGAVVVVDVFPLHRLDDLQKFVLEAVRDIILHDRLLLSIF